MKACKTCRFLETDTQTQHCRRFPPVFSGGSSSFPPVPDRFWCHEYRLSVKKWLSRVFGKARAEHE